MTARSDDPGVSPEAGAAPAAGEIWSTLEELLLACAVERYGTGSWDTVAAEVKSRCSPAAAPRLTPDGCRLRFGILRRRFASGDEDSGGGGEEPDEASVDECVEELRKLRVDELRREVARYDLSIGSLKSEVKRLEEERERSLSGEVKPEAKEEEGDEEAAVETGSPEDDEPAGGQDRVSGGESGRSCKESNSSDLKPPEHASAATVSAADDGGAAAKVEEEAAVKQEEPSGESVARSKDAEKESSDVQSSASPSRRRQRDGDPEAEAASPSPSAAAALPEAEAESLLAFLETVRTSKAGSVFERRLEIQDAEKYKSTIRRHVDLETIRVKLQGGGGGTCYASASEFYRDLLLLCANALVFFARGSPEHAAAGQTRALVCRHMSASLGKDQAGASGKAAASAASKKPKGEADVGSLLEKTAPIIVCRKRSSIAKAAAAAAAASAAAAAAAAKEDGAEEETESEDEKENEVKKKVAAKDKARGPRTNKTRGGRSGTSNQRAGRNSESDSAAAAEGTKKADKKGGAAAGGVAKKRNAVDFLNRMKQGSTASTERVSLLETLKLSAAAEQKKSGKGEGRKETGSSSKKGTDTPRGRRIGRPPKRTAAPPTPPPSKRARGGDRSSSTGRKRGGRR